MKYIFGVLTLLLTVAVFVAGAAFISNQSPAQLLQGAGVFGSLAQVESQPGDVSSSKVKGSAGKIDTDANGTFVYGWACQEGVSQSVNVQVYAGGLAGSGTLVASGMANVSNEAAVSTACGTNGVNHRFKVYLSNTVIQQHQGKKVYVYGVSRVGATESTLLHNSGNYTIPAPAPAVESPIAPSELTTQVGGVIGFIGKVDTDAGGPYISGWACQKSIAQSINVRVYANGPIGTGTLVTTAVANIAQGEGTAISTACGTSGINHRYKIYLSDSIIQQYQGKKIYVHGIRKSGTVENALLNNSGKFTFPTPAVAAPLPPVDISTKFSTNNRIVTNTRINVRETPGGTILGQQPKNSVGTVTIPPSSQNGSKVGANYWWHVNFDTGIDGWGAEQLLDLYTAPATPPTCSLSANPSSLTSGQSTTLSWTTTNATSVALNQGIGKVTPLESGTQLTSPTQTTTYTMTVSGAGGTATCATTVVVGVVSSCPANLPAPIIVDARSTTLTQATESAATATEVTTESLEEGEADTTSGRTLDTAEIYKSQLASAQPAAASSRVATVSGRWSDAATWGGSVPTASDNVRIPAGITVMLDTEAQAATVEVNGVLRALANTSSSLTTRWVMVMGTGGRFIVGTPEVPFLNTFTLTLIGNNTTENIHGAGSKFLMAMDGGEIRMHGQPQVSWTKLHQTAARGASEIKLAEPVGWAVGDQIVIAPSGINVGQTEVRTITGRSSDCLTLTLDKPLDYRHVGVQTRYTRPTDGKSWVLDQRAEVGLLTHNVKVQGNAVSESTGFGGHVMIMKGAKGFFSNIELYRVGQKKVMGRYPIHWHMAENTSSGQYIINSSIHHSYNRAVTLHGSEGVTIERNVAYDHVGHGIFLEDASERFNKINYNLVMMTRKPAPGDELLPSDNGMNVVQNRTPASFWITNPNNEFIGNVAAGTIGPSGNSAIGTGFWFAFPEQVLGLSANVPRFQGMVPRTEPLGVFKDNVAHSNLSGFDVHDSIDPVTHEIVINTPWEPAAISFIDNLTVYGSDLAVYTGKAGKPVPKLVEKLVFRNLISADILDEHLRFANADTVQNSLFVADSGNVLVPATGTRWFYGMYDGPGRVRNSHLVGFDKPGTSMIKLGGGAEAHANTIFSNITFDGSLPHIQAIDFTGVTASDVRGIEYMSTSIVDVTGSLTGTPGSTIISSNPMQRTSTDKPYPNGNMFISDKKFTHLRVAAYGTATSLKVMRSGGGEPAVSFEDSFVLPGTGNNRFQFDTIANQGFVYTVDLAKSSRNSITLFHLDGKVGDTILVRMPTNKRSMTLSAAWKEQPSITALQNATANSYFNNGTYLWLKFVRTSAYRDQATIALGAQTSWIPGSQLMASAYAGFVAFLDSIISLFK